MAGRVALGLILTLVAIGGVLSWWLLRTSDLASRAVAEANQVMSAPRVRPVHVPEPSPGAFSDALAVHLPPIEQVARRLDDASALQQLNQVNAGTRPLSELPEGYARALEQLEANIDGLLAGTHAARADLAHAKDPLMPAEGASWLGYQLAAKLTAVRVRRALADGHRNEAVVLCLDGLALGRDSAIAGGLIGRMIRTAVTGFLMPACIEVAASSGVDRPELVRRARAIRDAVPGLDSMLREESAEMQLMVFGRLLPEAQRARLVPRAEPLVGQAELPAGPLGRLLHRAAWRPIDRAYRELAEAARLPRDARSAAFEVFHARWARSWNPEVARFAETGRSFIRYANGDDIAVLRMDLVVFAAAAELHRDREGRWPASLEELELQPAERERLRGLAMSASEGRLRIHLTLPELEGMVRDVEFVVAP